MFLDANIFIHAYGSITGTKKHTQSKNQIKRIALGEMSVHTSVLVLNEVAHVFRENFGTLHSKKVFEQIRQTPNLKILPVDEAILGNVFFFVEQNMGITDAFHAATMKANGISTICSYDKGFDKIKGIKRQEPK